MAGPLKPSWTQPSHPDRIKVTFTGGDNFNSYALSTADLPAGALFAKMDSATEAPEKSYSTVQTPNGHIELNSDLLYCNHSYVLSKSSFSASSSILSYHICLFHPYIHYRSIFRINFRHHRTQNLNYDSSKKPESLFPLLPHLF